MKRCVEEVTRAIPSKDATGTVGAMCARRKSHHHQPRILGSEAGDRPGPIRIILKSSRLVAATLSRPSHESRTLLAANDGPLNRRELVHGLPLAGCNCVAVPNSGVRSPEYKTW